mmetsp:Transcript_49174/g.88824  ORF Transcript_49174/g.88824 Transcript_49174/m.88824 type:complete len:378 (-) Transcript_49174:144-1277(-)
MASTWTDRYAQEFQEPVALRIDEMESGNACAIHGVCSRNAVTGRVNLKRAQLFPDFTMVDLWTRPCVFGSPDQLRADKYIFTPAPFLYRTWMYHVTYQSPSEMARHHGVNGILTYVLGNSVIDLNNTHAGRYCPILYYFVLCLFSCLTCDFWFVVTAVLVSVTTLVIFVLLNDAFWYYWCRPLTLPIRLFLFFYMHIHLPVADLMKDGKIIVVFGVLLSTVVIVVDLFLGDLNMLISFGLHAHYEVLKELPGRVFVCRRHGAAFSQDWTRRPPVDPDISGMGEWAQDMHLIAEVRGIICELLPMTLEDWRIAWEMVRETGEPLPFIGLDIFDEFCATFQDTEMSPLERLNAMLERQDRAEAPPLPALKGLGAKNLIE